MPVPPNSPLLHSEDVPEKQKGETLGDKMEAQRKSRWEYTDQALSRHSKHGSTTDRCLETKNSHGTWKHQKLQKFQTVAHTLSRFSMMMILSTAIVIVVGEGVASDGNISGGGADCNLCGFFSCATNILSDTWNHQTSIAKSTVIEVPTSGIGPTKTRRL